MNNIVFRSLMRMVPSSVLEEIPKTVAQAVLKKLSEVPQVKDKMPVVLITSNSKDDTDCMITIANMDLQADFDRVEQFSGQKFVEKMIKEAGHE